MAYPGGKAGAGVFQKIINQIPPHDTLIEVCLGDGAITRRIRRARRSIGIDIDMATAAKFAGEVPDVEVYCCDGIEWLKHTFGLYRLAPGGDAAAGGDGSGVDESGGCYAGVAATFGDSAGKAFVYIDPAYLMSTRRGGKLYRHDMTDVQHWDLLWVIRRLSCYVMISGYPSPMYSASLENWRRISFQTTTRGGSLATECLWMNYEPPAELHDYRFLGNDKRERERIHRKARNWTAGLDRLPPLERQAIVRSITPRC